MKKLILLLVAASLATSCATGPCFDKSSVEYYSNQCVYDRQQDAKEPKWYHAIIAIPCFAIASLAGLNNDVRNSEHYKAGGAEFTDYTKPYNQPR